MTLTTPCTDQNGDSAGRYAADGLLLILANGLAGLFFLLVHVVLGRSMDGKDYAILVSLIGLLNVLSVGANALQLTVARFTADRLSVTTDAWHRLARPLALWSGPALLAWCVVAWLFREALGTPPYAALVVLGVIAGLQLFVPLAQGLLQGLRLFTWIASAAVVGGLVRWLTAWGIAVLGGGVTEVLGAFVLSALAALAVCLWPLRRRLRLKPSDAPASVEAPIYSYYWKVVAGQIALFTLMNADLVFAPRLLGEAVAPYSKAAILARTAIFLPLPIVAAMFPRAVASRSWRVLLGPLFLVLGVSITLAVIASTWPREVLAIMFGSFEEGAPQILGAYVWATIPLALIEVVLPWLWARDRLFTVISLTFPVLLFVAWLLRMPADALAIVSTLGTAAWLSLIWLAAAEGIRVVRSSS